MDNNTNYTNQTQSSTAAQNCQAPAEEKKGYSVAAMVLGIVGCCGPVFGLVCSILAIIFAAISLNRCLPGRKMAVAGLVTGIVGVVPAVIVIVLLIVGFSAVGVAGISALL